MADKTGIYLRGGTKASFSDVGNEIGSREIVFATDTKEIGTPGGWISSGGKVKNIYYTETPAERQDIYSNDPTIINGLSMTITPETEESTFIIVANVSSTFTYVASLLCFVNGVSLHSHENNSSAHGSIATVYRGNNDTNQMISVPLHARYDASGIEDITVDIRAVSNWEGNAKHMYINDRASNDMRTVSTMIIYEVQRN